MNTMSTEQFKTTDVYKRLKGADAIPFISMWKHGPEYIYEDILITFNGDTYRTEFYRDTNIDDWMDSWNSVSLNTQYTHNDRPTCKIHVNIELE